MKLVVVLLKIEAFTQGIISCLTPARFTESVSVACVCMDNVAQAYFDTRLAHGMHTG